jgi:hypothetical protein
MTVVMTSIRGLFFLLTLALSAAPVHAGNYPPGSRIGLTPPSGMVTSKSFFGYEDPDHNAAIILIALPVQAYADLDRSVTADALKRQGLTLEKREVVPLSTGKAFLVIGRQEIDKTKVRKWILVASSPALTALVAVQIPEPAKALYPDAAIRAALASLAIRAAVPIEEELGVLPFKIGDLAGFRVAGVVPGRSVALSDAPTDASPNAPLAPHLVVGIAPGGPAQAAERDAFAQDVFVRAANLRNIRITTSEPLRIGGQEGHQIFADARDSSNASALTVVQWLRFGGGAYLQVVGVARADAWKDAYPRFRSVRDSIGTR